MEKNKEQSKWDITLEKKLLELQECQKSLTLKSCFDCKDILACKLRNEYVQSVYESMSKGSVGGFEF